MNSEIIFDARHDQYGPIFFCMFGCLISILIAFILNKKRSKTASVQTIVFFLFASYMAISFLIFAIRAIQLKVDFSEALNSNGVSVVCGALTDFERTKEIGGVETFKVDGTDFKIPTLSGAMDAKYRGKSKFFEGSLYKVKFVVENEKQILFMQLVNEC